MRNRFLGGGLIIVGLGWATLGLGAQPILLHETQSGAYSLPVSAPGQAAKPTVPSPLFIVNEAGWKSFLAGIPNKVPGGQTMGGMVENYDYLVLRPAPDFAKQSLVVVFQDASRTGPVRWDSGSVSKNELVYKTTTFDLGHVEARPVNLGFYTAFLLPALPAAKTAKRENVLVKKAEIFRIDHDEATDRYGIRSNLKKDWIVKPIYDHADNFDLYDHAFVHLAKEGFVLVDATGKIIVKSFIYDNAWDYFSEGLARYVDDGGRVGFIDWQGKIIIPAQFQVAGKFEDGLAEVRRGSTSVQNDEHRTWIGGEINTIDQTGKLTGAWKKAN